MPLGGVVLFEHIILTETEGTNHFESFGTAHIERIECKGEFERRNYFTEAHSLAEVCRRANTHTHAATSTKPGGQLQRCPESH